MTDVERIAEELKLSFEGDENGQGRFAPSLMHNLKGIDAHTAAARPIANAHTIWEIVWHVTEWKKFIAGWLHGRYEGVTDETDWRPIAHHGEQAWEDALKELKAAHEAVMESVKILSDADLFNSPPNRTILRNTVLQGIIQHNQYHGGQIVLLKKAQEVHAHGIGLR